MALFWPIKSASTRGGFELPAVALESKPQTFSSIALVLEKSQMGCLLLAEQIPYYSSQSPPGLLACLDPTLVKPLLQQWQGKIQASRLRAAKANAEEATCSGAPEPKPLRAACREPETGVWGSGYLLADPEPEAGFTLLESSHKGELSGGKSLESSAE